MQHQDINDYVKEKFIFVYDRRLLRHLRANNHRYLVEAINQVDKYEIRVSVSNWY